MTTGDFNGDNAPDVAAAILGGGVAVYLNDGTGQMSAPVLYPAANAEGAEWMVPADLNGDGKLDLATGSTHTNAISVYYNNGDGTFAPAARVALGTPSAGLAAGDLTGDGRVDLISVGYSAYGLQLLVNNGDGTFTRRNISTLGNPVAVVVGDFNHDGSLDLATANANENTVTVLLNRGDGVFPKPHQATYRVGQGSFDIATGDLNNDGFLDLVTANVGDNTFSVLFNRADGTGTFRKAVPFTGAGGQVAVVTADVNNDGLADIVGANPFGDNIMVLLNKGGHTFLPASSCTVGGFLGPIQLASADFNGDGVADIVTANRQYSVSVLLSGS